MPSAAAATGSDDVGPERDAPATTTVGGLVASAAAVPPEARVADVAERFFRSPELDAVALVADDRRPVGVLTRARLLLKLARGFGHELYARKPVTRLADLDPVILRGDTPLADAVHAALSRPGDTLYDDVVVVDASGAYLGLVPIRDLVLQQRVAYVRSAAAHEAAIAKTRELEKLDQLRRRFLAHATHELRSPVNAIVFLAEILRAAAGRDDLAKVKERLPILLGAADGLRATVTAMLDLSRLEAGQARISASRVPIAPLLDEVAQTARLLVREKPVAVIVDAGEPLEVETDRLKLRQILLNLASNAAKFTAAGSVTLEARPDGAGCRIAVRDTGPGIREEDLARLFVPFGQLEDASTKSHEGTGLGLVITRSLATLLGGTVRVESRLGAGATFIVALPPHPPRSPHP